MVNQIASKGDKMKKFENIKWFASVLFALLTHDYLLNLFDFKYNPFNDSFDITKLLIDFGVFFALLSCASFVIDRFKK